MKSIIKNTLSSLLTIILIVAAIALTVFGWWYNSPSQKGKRGEARIHKILERLSDEYTIMDDVILETNSGTTQIDHIVVSKYGVFAIETKNYRGDIYGDDNRQEWTQIIATDVTYSKKWWKTYTYITKNKFYNPVKQAYGHMYVIKKYLEAWPSLRVIPIVVFAGDANLKNVRSNIDVIYDESLLKTINSYQTAFLSDSEVKDVVDTLVQVNVRDSVDNNTHVRNVKARKRESDLLEESGICPRCGGTLVRRTGRYGTFYGCSNYPQCKFTTN